MKKFNAMLLLDGYKLGHRKQYPKGTEKVYSTWTPRGSRIEGVSEVPCFGIQMFVKKWLIEYFDEFFFKGDINEITSDYKRFMKAYLGEENADTSHIEALHKLGFLPLKIKALPEGTMTPLRVPMITMENTLPEFYWLTNYIETIMSSELWYTMTSTSTSMMYKKILNKYHMETVGHTNMVKFSAHDFSFRGQSSYESAILSGLGHLLSFVGTDTVPAILAAEKYYGADIEKELVGCSVNATEHAVMEAGGKSTEYDTYHRLLTEVYPKGIVSVVSDTWDYWKVITETLLELKDVIINREGTLTVRPDSGNPKDIICGTFKGQSENRGLLNAQEKGSIEVLWDTFGGTTNELGYKVLDPHISLIYGEAIQPELMDDILNTLKEKGFASTNVLFGVGSYGFLSGGVSGGIATRDTYGFAVKATYTVIDGVEVPIFKDPKTDDGLKKSQRGMVAVCKNADGKITYTDGLLKTQLDNVRMNLLEDVFVDGKLVREQTLAEIRAILTKE